jgi:amino acid transporter
MKRHWRKALKFLVFAVVAAVVLSVAVMSLWNWLMPPIFGWRLITFWQALGLLVLSRVLFGRFSGGPGRRMHWRHRMMERWNQMTPEEREKFAEGMRGHCQRSGAKGTAPTT